MTNPFRTNLLKFTLAAVLAGFAPAVLVGNAGAQSATGGSASQATPTNTAPPSDADVLLNLFQKRGLISDQDVQDAHAALASRTNNAAAAGQEASRWKIADSIKSIQIFGDARLRYEYRGTENVPGTSPSTFDRERFRYALRFGVRGDLVDDFSYGIRLETANNPRSPWDTFGNNTTAGSVTASDKNSSIIYVGQLFMNWHPADWYEMSVGRMPMPLYTTPMVWDSDINPEGAFEKFKLSTGAVDWFADFGQFDYQDPASGNEAFSSDTFVLAWQAGANVRMGKAMSFKIAPVFYNYTGRGTAGNGLNLPYVGQGSAGVNVGVPGGANVPGFNENGINNLSVLEIPAEFNLKISNSPLGPLQARVFGDFAYNYGGYDRATAAFNANPAAFPGVTSPATGQNKAYQVGVGIGSAVAPYGPTQGLVYGSYSKKNAWEARAYYQHIEQYSLDVNLIDSDFFEGRANLQGVYAAFAYGLTDAMIGTIRYGYASRIRTDLGTGGNNLDIPAINPINNYNLLQLDLTWRF